MQGPFKVTQKAFFVLEKWKEKAELSSNPSLLAPIDIKIPVTIFVHKTIIFSFEDNWVKKGSIQ